MGALLVVAPRTCDVTPFVFTDTLALTVIEIDGTDVVVLPNEFVFIDRVVAKELDGRLIDVPVAMLKLEADIEGEVAGSPVDRPVLMLVDGRLDEIEVPRTEVGRFVLVAIDVDGMLKVVPGNVGEIWVFRVVLDKPKEEVGTFKEVLGRPGDVDGRPTDVLGTLSEVPVLSEDVGMFNEVLGRLTEMPVLMDVEDKLAEVDGKLNAVLESVTDIPVVMDEMDTLVVGKDIPVLMLVVGSEIDGDDVGSDIVVLKPPFVPTEVKLTVDDNTPVIPLVVAGIGEVLSSRAPT